MNCLIRWIVLAFAAATLVLSHGCGSDSKSRIETMPAARIAFGSPTGEMSWFWILSDSQLHNVAGAPTRSKTALGDWLSPTALRPPSLDLWSDAVLAEVVEKIGETEAPVFFLGDAADVSCIGELARFLDVMAGRSPQSRPLPWLGVLGNHDGYYLGNMAFRPHAKIDAAPRTSQGPCQHSTPRGGIELESLERHFLEDIGGKGEYTHVKQGTLTKAHAVWMYLSDLAGRMDVAGDLRPDRIENWRLTSDAEHYLYATDIAHDDGTVRFTASVRGTVAALNRAERAHEKSRAWQAMVVQDVTLADGVHVLLIDTTDYAWTPPTSVRQARSIAAQYWLDTCRSSDARLSIPGVCGEVGPHQVALIKEMMSTWARDTRFFVMGHHPWASLRAPSADALKFLRTTPGFMTYVSAHTHAPVSTRDFDATLPWEINVGSTTDWPMEYGRLRYWPNDDGVTGTPLQLDVDYAASDEVCPYASTAEALDEIVYGNAADYTARALDAYEEIFRMLSRDDWADVWRNVEETAASLRWPRLRLDPYVTAMQDQIVAARGKSVDDQRALLADLVEFDRHILREEPRLRQVEAACAIWASAVECAKNDCAARKSHGLGGTESRSFRFRVGPATFPAVAP